MVVHRHDSDEGCVSAAALVESRRRSYDGAGPEQVSRSGGARAPYAVRVIPIRRYLLRCGRTLLVLAVFSTAILGIATNAAPASASATPIGHLERVTQDGHGLLSVRGWAVDRARGGRSTSIDIVIDGHVTAHLAADVPRGDVDRALRIPGAHGFSWSGVRARAHIVTVIVRSVARGGPSTPIGTAYLNGYSSATIGARIISHAAQLVGDAYAEGGAGPTSFDCSGYTAYLYRVAGVGTLAHNAETQRHQVRIIPAGQARRGDLIFYLSGNTAYHVAIYAGGGTGAFTGYQYAAAAPGEGVKYQHIWSSDIQFGTDWH